MYTSEIDWKHGSKYTLEELARQQCEGNLGKSARNLLISPRNSPDEWFICGKGWSFRVWTIPSWACFIQFRKDHSPVHKVLKNMVLLAHLQCVVSFLQIVPKSALFPWLLLVRLFWFPFLESHLPCLQQKLFYDPNPWTAKNRNYPLSVFLRQPVTRSCSTATFWQTPWSQQTRWTLLKLSLIIPKWTAISLASQSLLLFWFLIHFRLSVLPFEALFLIVCSKPPANRADCSGTDPTGTTDWLTDPDDW